MWGGVISSYHFSSVSDISAGISDTFCDTVDDLLDPNLDLLKTHR